jgi:hypothetical protein
MANQYGGAAPLLWSDAELDALRSLHYQSARYRTDHGLPHGNALTIPEIAAGMRDIAARENWYPDDPRNHTTASIVRQLNFQHFGPPQFLMPPHQGSYAPYIYPRF